MILNKKLTNCIIQILLCCFLSICIIVLLLYYHFGQVLNFFDRRNNFYYGDPIDVVYTWVNGSDLIFQHDLNEYLSKSKLKLKDSSYERFNDKDELKFSIRSLEKYAPWVNHVYIVTNGQIPYWLNLDYEKVSVISHEDIFQDLHNLPTFSSPAIEFNIHRIPGLSKKFIYFNDDIFLGAPIYPEDFYFPKKGYLIYLSWPLHHCMPNCSWSLVGDGHCDAGCYYDNCQFDGNDCASKKQEKSKKIYNMDDHNDKFKHVVTQYEYLMDDKKLSLKELKNKSFVFQGGGNTNLSDLKPPTAQQNNFETLLNHSKTQNSKSVHDTLNGTVNNFTDHNLETYFQSLQNTHKLFNLIYGFNARRLPSHMPILIDKEIMFNLRSKFSQLIDEKEKNRVRTVYDFQFSFMYDYYLINEKMPDNKFKYRYKIMGDHNMLTYVKLTSNVSQVVYGLDKIRKLPRKFICINDRMSSTNSQENVRVKAILFNFYISFFPKSSKFELNSENRVVIKIFYIISVFLISLVLYNYCKRRLIRQLKKIIYF